MQAGLPETKSADATFGTQIHAAFEGQRPDLTADQWDVLEAAIQIESNFKRDVLVCQEEERWTMHREKRLWATENGKPLCSGQADALWINQGCTHAFIEDLKSLFGDVQEASENMQLRDLAALVFENYGVQFVGAFINQPLATHNPQTVVYTFEDLERAHADMVARVKRSMTPGQPRTPGERQCKYCKAAVAGKCPEFLEWLGKGVAVIEPQPDVSLIQPEKLAQAWRRWKEVAPFFKKIEETLKAMPDEQLDGLGLRHKPGAKVRHVTDAFEASELAVLHGLCTPREFFECAVDVSLTGLETFLTDQKLMPKKAAAKKVAEILGSVIEEKQNKPSLSEKE